MQFSEDENSRTYLDFDTINDALDGKYSYDAIYHKNSLPPFVSKSLLALNYHSWPRLMNLASSLSQRLSKLKAKY